MDDKYVIEVHSTLPLFDKKRWIGRGKKFPSNSFNFPDLKGYCEEKLSIPKDSYSYAFPDNQVTVKDFLVTMLDSVC